VNTEEEEEEEIVNDSVHGTPEHTESFAPPQTEEIDFDAEEDGPFEPDQRTDPNPDEEDAEEDDFLPPGRQPDLGREDEYLTDGAL
jgi:hypothetical protein